MASDEISSFAAKTGVSESPPSILSMPLQQADPEIFSLIEEEKYRQRYGIELIASEVLVSIYL